MYTPTDYKAALKEFTMVIHTQLDSTSPPLSPSLSVSVQVSGKIPLPPRYAFGIYYSRYWAYDDIGDMVYSETVCVCVCVCVCVWE